ncbi:MAG: hypothetical protein ACRCXZ_05910 [Patescibacteria group bacterium]
MTQLYLVANKISGGGSFSPRVFQPFGIFDKIENANNYILSLDNFWELSIIILDSGSNLPIIDFKEIFKKFHIQKVSKKVLIPPIKEGETIFFVTSTSHVDLGDLRSLFPEFSLNLHGLFSTYDEALLCLNSLSRDELKSINYSSDPIVTNTFFNPYVGPPIAILAQHYDINLLTGEVKPSYKITVKQESLNKIKTSVNDGVNPYLAFTNVDPCISDLNAYVKNLVHSERIKCLHNAAELIFTAKDWNKPELVKYLFAKYDEEENQIFLHLIDYPDQKTVFDNNRMYIGIQKVCNYISSKEKDSGRLNQLNQKVILQKMIDFNPTR